MKIVTKIRKALKPGHVKKQYKAGRNKSLDRIGSFTMQSAKKQFLNKQPKKKPVWRKVGDQDGIPVLEVQFRPPTTGRVTSWKTGRGRAARGFLRGSVRYERDDRRESVVIGPAERAVWLNRIQEFGGSRSVSYRYLAKRPIKGKLRNGHSIPNGMGAGGGVGGRDARGRFLAGSGGQAYVVMRRDASTGRKSSAGEFRRARGKVKPGRYMAKGLDKVRPKIPAAFKNFIQGP
jgi:hypothetical protein